MTGPRIPTSAEIIALEIRLRARGLPGAAVALRDLWEHCQLRATAMPVDAAQEREELDRIARQQQTHQAAAGYGVIRDLPEALRAADQAEREGLRGWYPAACVVLARALRQRTGESSASTIEARPS